MSKLSTGLALTATLIASSAMAEEPITTCNIDDGRLIIDIADGDFADQRVVINLEANGNRYVNVGGTPYSLSPTNDGRSIIEAAGNINEAAVELNDERGRNGLSYQFFVSQQQPEWKMLSIGITQDASPTIRLGVSDSENDGFKKDVIVCTGNQDELEISI